MQSDSISKRFDQFLRSSLDRFDLSSTTSSTTTSISNKDSLSRFQKKEEEEEVTSSQRDDFQMAATLMRSPDRVVQATAVNLLDDTSFDSLESPAQVIPETPPRSVKKKKKNENLKKSFAFRLSKFTFQKVSPPCILLYNYFVVMVTLHSNAQSRFHKAVWTSMACDRHRHGRTMIFAQTDFRIYRPRPHHLPFVSRYRSHREVQMCVSL